MKSIKAGEGVSHREALLYTLLYTLLTGNQMSEFTAWAVLVSEDIQLFSLIMKEGFGFKNMPTYITYILVSICLIRGMHKY